MTRPSDPLVHLLNLTDPSTPMPRPEDDRARKKALQFFDSGLHTSELKRDADREGEPVRARSNRMRAFTAAAVVMLSISTAASAAALLGYQVSDVATLWGSPRRPHSTHSTGTLRQSDRSVTHASSEEGSSTADAPQSTSEGAESGRPASTVAAVAEARLRPVSATGVTPTQLGRLRCEPSMAQTLDTAQRLEELAYVCQRSGRRPDAVLVHQALRLRFAGTAEARNSAFTLGRLLFVSDPEASRLAFRSYRHESPNGAFVREALGRELELSQGSDRVELARLYLTRYPTGPHASVAQFINSQNRQPGVDQIEPRPEL